MTSSSLATISVARVWKISGNLTEAVQSLITYRRTMKIRKIDVFFLPDVNLLTQRFTKIFQQMCTVIICEL